MLANLRHYLKLLNILSNQSETVPENFSGLDPKPQMVNGTDSTLKSSQISVRSTLTKYTLGRNIITIRTTMNLPQSKDTSFSTTTQASVSITKHDGLST